MMAAKKKRDQYGKLGKLSRKTVRAEGSQRAATKPKIYWVTTGTRRVMADPGKYTDLAGARGKAKEALLEWLTWCGRHNIAGMTPIHDALEVVAAWNGDMDRRIEVDFDPHTGTHMIVLLEHRTADGRTSRDVTTHHFTSER